MSKYICYFSYSSNALKAMIENPTDRGAAARALVEAAGGRMESFYWMHGDHDGFFIAEFEDGTSVAAVGAAAASTGSITRVETHKLFDSAAQNQILRTARAALAGYTPPTG